MFSRLFPKQFDNNYRGHRLAVWILAIVVLLRIAQSINAMDANPWIDVRFVIQGADRIPLDRFSTDAADVIILKTMLWGFTYLLINLLCITVLIRYRTMIPLMFLLLLADQIGRMALVAANPIVRTGEPSPWLQIPLLITIGAMFIGFVTAQLTPASRNDDT